MTINVSSTSAFDAAALAGSVAGFFVALLRVRVTKGRVLNMVFMSCRNLRDSHHVSAAKMMAAAEIVNGTQSVPSAIDAPDSWCQP